MSRNILLEIEGLAVGFTSNGTTNASSHSNWATSFEERITKQIPPSQGMKVDPFTGSFDSQGTGITLNSVADLLIPRKSGGNRTTLGANLSDTDLSMTVASTSGFSSSGTIFVGREAITYTSIDATHFYGLGRAKFGSDSTYWTEEIDPRTSEKRRVYDYNPFFQGRLCKITWYDPATTTDKTTRFVGYIDNPRFTGSGFTLDVINGKKLLDDSEIMAGRFAKASLAGAFMKRTGFNNYENLLSSQFSAILVNLEDSTYPFPEATLATPLHFQIGEEIIEYTDSEESAISGTIAAIGSGTYGYYFDTDEPFERGDFVLINSTLKVLITKVDTGVSADFRCYHNGSTNGAVSNTLSAPSKQKLGEPLSGAKFGSLEETHKIGEELKEVRILQGDRVDILLQLLLSTGYGYNGDWDVLPEGWGAAIPEKLIDTVAFEAIRDYSDSYTPIFDSPAKVSDLIEKLARVTNSRIFWNNVGVLTVKAERDLYPDSESQLTINKDNLKSDALPSWSAPLANVYNSWVIKGNSPKGKDFADILHFEDFESSQFYGKRSLPDLEDGGLLLSQSANKLELLGKAVLKRWSRPTIQLDLQLAFSEDFGLTPGDLVAVTIPHLPDLEGDEGLTASLFEIIEVFPQDGSGSISITAIQMPPQSDTRLVAPCGEVASLSGSDITLKAASATHYSPTDPPDNIAPLSENGQTGTEDIHYFSEGDPIQIIDASSFSGAANSHATTISAIDYPAKKITLASLPGWTIGGGDLVRYDEWSSTEGTHPSLVAVFAFLADSYSEIDGENPHQWGA